MRNWKISYYNERVEQVILNWPRKILAKYIRITDLIEEFGPDLGMPFTKPLGDGLFEVRAKGREGIGRALFCGLTGNEIVILHAFIKKTDKIPHHDLTVARKRLREVKE